MNKIANPQQLQDRLRQLVAMCQGPNRPSRQRLAEEMRKLARQLDGGRTKQARLTDYQTLEELFDMEVDSWTGGADVEVDVPGAAWRAIEQTAERYEDAIESALLEWAKANIEKFRLGEKALRTVKKPQDVVDVMMSLRGGAGFLYFMEAEGAGVGTWDGDWDILFKEPRESLRELSKFIERKTHNAYQKFKDALMDGASQSVPEGDYD